MSLTFGPFSDISLTSVQFPDISRFSRQTVILTMVQAHTQLGSWIFGLYHIYILKTTRNVGQCQT